MLSARSHGCAEGLQGLECPWWTQIRLYGPTVGPWQYQSTVHGWVLPLPCTGWVLPSPPTPGTARPALPDMTEHEPARTALTASLDLTKEILGVNNAL